MKNKKQSNPFDTPLDAYEQELESFLEKGEFVSASKKELEETKKMLQEAAKNYRKLQETKSITLRVKRADLLKVKAKAQQKGIAYQTLINLLLHQYVLGQTEVKL